MEAKFAIKENICIPAGILAVGILLTCEISCSSVLFGMSKVLISHLLSDWAMSRVGGPD